MQRLDQQALKQHADQLYEQYGKPLLDEHRGKYVAISADGKTVLARTLPEVLEQSLAILGPGAFVFQLGKQAVYSWR